MSSAGNELAVDGVVKVQQHDSLLGEPGRA